MVFVLDSGVESALNMQFGLHNVDIEPILNRLTTAQNDGKEIQILQKHRDKERSECQNHQPTYLKNYERFSFIPPMEHHTSEFVLELLKYAYLA